MAFLNIFGADFFNIQDKDTPNVPTTSSSSGSSFTPVASSSRNNSYTLPSPAVPTRPTSHQSLPALHIPLHMTPSYHPTSSSSLRKPDSGYYSAFSNSSGSHSFSAMSPLSPLDTRSGYAFQPALPAIIATAIALSAITSCKSSAIFPYRFDDGTPALVSRMPSDQLAEDQIERANRTCERCDSKVDNQRAHMGAHILRKLRGVEEAVKTPVTGDFPCGFCGETGRSECAVFVKVASKSTSVETNCRLKGPIKYAYAERGSATTPCRNVPLVCILCPSQLTAEKASARQPAQWRYNMEAHLAVAHPEYASPHNPNGVKRLPITVLESFELQRPEQLALGIPAHKIPPKFIKVADPMRAPICNRSSLVFATKLQFVRLGSPPSQLQDRVPALPPRQL
ncbi:hypothetical protein DFH09DRAFT_1364826 [Mycena vulgaris]|nr:hypothetical protein DFH09DRAFT_1364826 [Mycena vulgaris]